MKVRAISIPFVAAAQCQGGFLAVAAILDPAGSVVAGRRPTISAAGLSWFGATADLPRPSAIAGLPWPTAIAGLLWARIRRTDHRAAATAAGSGSATTQGCYGVDPRLLELGARRLGVGAGPLYGPSLPSRRLGSRPLAPPGTELGLGSGTLAPVASGLGMVAE